MWPFGKVEIDFANGALHAPRDTHMLDGLRHFSVRRPLLPLAMMFGSSALVGCWSFHDILYPGEATALYTFAAVCAFGGWFIGRLKLRSREMRSGDELAESVWGFVPALDKQRMEIVQAVASVRRAER